MFLRRKLLQFTSILVILTILFSSLPMGSVLAQGKDGLKRQVNPQTGRVSFLGPENGTSLRASQALGIASPARPTDPALALAKRFGSEFGLRNPERELSLMKTHRAENGRIIARYQQDYQGIPVMGGELIVNTNDSGDLYSMNGEVSPDLSLSTQPTIDSEQAKQTALQAVAKWYQKTSDDFQVSEPELWIFDESLLRSSIRPAELVWRMEIKPTDIGMPVRELVLVNAQRGNIDLHFNQVDTEFARKNGTAQANQFTRTVDSVAAAISTRQVKSNAFTGELGPLAVATWYVAPTGNDANSCSSTGSPCQKINGAIGKAAAGDTIKIATGSYTGSGVEVVLINKNINLSGGWNASFTTQSGTSTIDGQTIRRGLTVNPGVSSVVEYLTILNGIGNVPGGAWGGGGIRNEGSLTINNSVLSNNASAVAYGGSGVAIYNANGAALVLNNSIVSHNGNSQTQSIVFNEGTFTANNSIVERNMGRYTGSYIIVLNSSGIMILTNTTIRDNHRGTAIANDGSLTIAGSVVSGNIGAFGPGGIANGGGTLTINNSTISGNEAPDYGAGLAISGASTVTINNSTIAGNRSDNGNSGSSGGISVNSASSTVTLKNSILARNTEYQAPDCFGTIISAGYNLIGNNSGCTFIATTGDQVGTSTNPIDPQLALLQDNGGSTFTQALLTGSPALNAGNPAVPGSGGNACLANDQRGVTRSVSTRCDIGAFEGSSSGIPFPLLITYTGNNTTNTDNELLCTQSTFPCTGTDSHADAAHQYAAGTYNFYKSQFNRNSIDNNGMTIISTVHHDSNYANAFWNGFQMIYGDAHGFPLADDVVAHEMTHGITEYESNLFYYYQSGAINESFSDLWGEYYDQTNGLGNDTDGVKWQMGEDVSGAGVIRNMSDPTLFGDPDKMSSPNYFEGEEDSGGVHYNSGVNNKAVYLMVDGGTFNSKTVSPLGWDKTAAIYYQVNTNLLSSGADYWDLYYALQQACTNLIGQKGITAADCAEMKDAIDAVEMNGQPAPNFNTDAPFCDVGDPVATILSDDLESGTENWTFAPTNSYRRWQYDSPYGPYAQSGFHSLYAADQPAIVTDATARLKSFVVPGNAYLRFAQAYDFETGYISGNPPLHNFDGGVLEYSINNSLTWLDAGSLINFNGYKGMIYNGDYPSPTYSNPLKGRSAFVGTSHGYISTRLNLYSLVGQTVSFRWRMGLDEGGSYGGWWVDDVRIYQCPEQETTPTNTSTPTATATPSPTGTMSQTPTSTPTTSQTSTPTATPVVSHDRDTTGVFRPSNGLLYLKNQNTTGFADVAINYGLGGDYPVVGDWDGNGTATIGVYRGGKFYLRNSNTLGFADLVFAFGTPGDQPVAGDWDGDGMDTIGVYRPSNGLFLLRNSNSAGAEDMSFYLGNVGDVGIAGDWNGDGKDTTGVFRPSNGIIFLKNTNETGFADIALNYGIPGDKPVTGDWNNDGIDTIGVYRNGQFLLRNSNTVGFADIAFGLGIPGDMPIGGNWDSLP